MKELLWAIVLGIVEGVTEFLPVSSTGHLLLCEIWMGIDLEHDRFWKMFAIFIQVGAILAVVVYFRKRILNLMKHEMGMPAGGRIPTVWLVLIATLPVMVVGKLAKDWVDRNMSTPTVIAAALGIGGVLMLLIERLRPRVTTEKMERMSLMQALIVGCAQCLAVLFPGTSRSAATIMSGLLTGLSREAAAEFSFFLAIPAMFMAATYSLY
jgi:undecaprenyl-diphosphatase